MNNILSLILYLILILFLNYQEILEIPYFHETNCSSSLIFLNEQLEPKIASKRINSRFGFRAKERFAKMNPFCWNTLWKVTCREGKRKASKRQGLKRELSHDTSREQKEILIESAVHLVSIFAATIQSTTRAITCTLCRPANTMITRTL